MNIIIFFYGILLLLLIHSKSKSLNRSPASTQSESVGNCQHVFNPIVVNKITNTQGLKKKWAIVCLARPGKLSDIAKRNQHIKDSISPYARNHDITLIFFSEKVFPSSALEVEAPRLLILISFAFMNFLLSYILYITQLKLLLFITIIYGNIYQSWRATFLNIASVQFISTKDRSSNKLMINYQLDNLNYNFIRKQNQGIPLCTGEVWLQIHVQIFRDRYV